MPWVGVKYPSLCQIILFSNPVESNLFLLSQGSHFELNKLISSNQKLQDQKLECRLQIQLVLGSDAQLHQRTGSQEPHGGAGQERQEKHCTSALVQEENLFSIRCQTRLWLQCTDHRSAHCNNCACLGVNLYCEAFIGSWNYVSLMGNIERNKLKISWPWTHLWMNKKKEGSI